MVSGLNDSDFDPGYQDRLSRFATLIHQWNSRINLTGYKTIQRIHDQLMLESAAALSILKLSNESVLDFGSGAGVPGLVWACCKSSLQVTSLEIRQKKIAFQKEVVREIGISAEVICGLFPAAVQGRQFDVIVSRAIRYDPSLWEECGSLLLPNGVFVRFAAPGSVERGWNSVPASSATTLLVKKP
jgi:16S rRNA (guanine527-N7)-methyltransferase